MKHHGCSSFKENVPNSPKSEWKQCVTERKQAEEITMIEHPPLYIFPRTKLILPFLNYFYLTLFAPHLIKLNKVTRSYQFFSASIIRKVLSATWHSLIALYSIRGCLDGGGIAFSKSATFNAIYRLTYFAFVGCIASWLEIFWRKWDKIPLILNEGNEIYNQLMKFDREPRLGSCKYQKLVKHLKWILILMMLILTYSTSLSYILGGLTSDKGFIFQINQFVNSTMASFCHSTGYRCTRVNPTSDPTLGNPDLLAYFIAFLWLVSALAAESSWMIFLLMCTMWGFYFKQLLILGLRRISSSTTNVETLLATSLFGRITLLLDQFNDTYGMILLTSICMAVLYKSMSFAMFIGGFSLGLLADLFVLASFVPCLTMLYSMAEVHKLGIQVPDILKRKCILKKDHEAEPMSLEIMHACNIIHHDVLANNIGFKGLGFFTISYAFAGSMIGIIVTYTMVLVQLTSKL